MDEVRKKNEAVESVIVRKIGNSAGLILPKDLLNRLKIKEGDTLYLTDEGEGGFRLSPYDPDHVRALAVAREVMDEYKDTFRELAK